MSSIPFEPTGRNSILDATSLSRGAFAQPQSAGLFDRHLYGGDSQSGLSAASSPAPTSTPQSTDSQSRRESASETKPAESSTARPRESENQRSTSSSDDATASANSDADEPVSDESQSSPADAPSTDASSTEESSPDAQSVDSLTADDHDSDASKDDGEQSPADEAAAQLAAGAVFVPSATDKATGETEAASGAKPPTADLASDSAQQPNGAAGRLQATQAPYGANGSQPSGEGLAKAASGEANGDEANGDVRNATRLTEDGEPGDALKRGEIAGSQASANSREGALGSQGSASPDAASAAQVGQVQQSEQKSGSGNADRRSRRRGSSSTADRIGKTDAPNTPTSQAGDARKTSSDAARVESVVDAGPVAESASLQSPGAGTDRSGSVVGSTLSSATDTGTGSHAGPRGAEPNSSAPTLSESDHARFMQRVVRAVHSAHQRNGEVRLRLSPPELGSLRIALRVELGAMTARVEAETPEARSLLLDGLPQLRERLAEQGIRVERFDVDLLDRQGEQSPQTTTDNNPQQQQQQSPNRRTVMEPSSEPVPGSPSPATSGRPSNDGKLNVLI